VGAAAIPNPNPADVLGGQVWPSFFRKDLPTLRRRRSGDAIETGRKLNQSEPIPCSEPRAASASLVTVDDKNSTGRAGRLISTGGPPLWPAWWCCWLWPGCYPGFPGDLGVSTVVADHAEPADEVSFSSRNILAYVPGVVLLVVIGLLGKYSQVCGIRLLINSIGECQISSTSCGRSSSACSSPTPLACTGYSAPASKPTSSG
jgi:hypothetical protein